MHAAKWSVKESGFGRHEMRVIPLRRGLTAWKPIRLPGPVTRAERPGGLGRSPSTAPGITSAQQLPRTGRDGSWACGGQTQSACIPPPGGCVLQRRGLFAEEAAAHPGCSPPRAHTLHAPAPPCFFAMHPTMYGSISITVALLSIAALPIGPGGRGHLE
jgi:hypothetical protein